jgi:hypothetical protein
MIRNDDIAGAWSMMMRNDENAGAWCMRIGGGV